MNSRRLACVLGAVLCCAPVLAVCAPVDQAYERVRATFSQKAPLVPNPQVLHADWQPAPFDPAPYTFTVEEIHANWDQFMRGLRLPYPSADYLQARYQRFPNLYRDLRYQDDDWEQHSRNVLEVWQAFFRGDFRHARDLSLIHI